MMQSGKWTYSFGLRGGLSGFGGTCTGFGNAVAGGNPRGGSGMAFLPCKF
jgi:hypothetical protein